MAHRTSEGQIQRAILDALPLLGVVAWRTQSGTRSGGRMHLAPSGTPDIVGYRIRDAKFIAIECKAPGGKPSPEQVAWLARAQASGVLCGIARGVDDVVRILQDDLRGTARG